MISDVHAYDGAPRASANSLVSTGMDQNPLKNPIAGLESLIEEEEIEADYLVVLGDMADQGDPAAVSFVWKWLNEVTARLNARLLATPGNHDLDSRLIHNHFDARDHLLQLDPLFPFDHEFEERRHFWTTHFAMIDADDTRFIILNSSAHHAHVRIDEEGRSQPEYGHGRVADSTLSRISAALERTGPFERNILILHHHPQNVAVVDGDDTSALKGGAGLLNLIANAQAGPFLVLHGHKHVPNIAFGSGGNSAPIVFGAGTFSATFYPEAQGHATNQFYVLELAEPNSSPGVVAGTFQAWDWADTVGWSLSGTGPGLPGVGGFGFRGTIESLSSSIADADFVDPVGHVAWTQVVASLPRVQYLMPSDIESLDRELRRVGIDLVIDNHGKPIGIESR